MPSIPDYIAALAPALAADTRISVFTTIATSQTNARVFGDNYLYAIALRVCHLLTRNPVTQPGAPGAVSMAQEGGVQQQYQISPDLLKKYGDLCTTPYGAQLAQLIEGSVFAPIVSGGPLLSPVAGIGGYR